MGSRSCALPANCSHHVEGLPSSATISQDAFIQKCSSFVHEEAWKQFANVALECLVGVWNATNRDYGTSHRDRDLQNGRNHGDRHLLRLVCGGATRNCIGWCGDFTCSCDHLSASLLDTVETKLVASQQHMLKLISHGPRLHAWMGPH
jgi:hypothetical protein